MLNQFSWGVRKHSPVCVFAFGNMHIYGFVQGRAAADAWQDDFEESRGGERKEHNDCDLNIKQEQSFLK